MLEGLSGPARSSHSQHPHPPTSSHTYAHAEKDQSTLLSTAEAPYFDENHTFVATCICICLLGHVFTFCCWCCMLCGCGRACNVVGAVCCKRAGNVPCVRCETMVMLLFCRSLSWMCHYRSDAVMRRISRLSRQRSSCETHVIHMSYTCHTRVIHIPYTRHMSYTCVGHVDDTRMTCMTCE